MDIALFSPSSLFDESDADCNSTDEGNIETNQNFVERRHQFPGMVSELILFIIFGYPKLIFREFSFHQLNANLQWPGTFAFVEWLVHHRSWLQGRRVIELGSGTGALAIFLQKSFQIDVTTSDYDDAEIEENIVYNCQINGVTPVLHHIRHVKQYANLIKSLSFLLKSYKRKATEAISLSEDGNHDACLLPRPAFLMSWRRRIGKEDESLFFNGCENAGLEVDHLGSRVYCIKPSETTASFPA